MSRCAETENPCIAGGCRGSCCHDMVHPRITTDELDVLAPEGTPRVYIRPEDLPTIAANSLLAIMRGIKLPTIVYVAPIPHLRLYDVFLAGDCSNLQAGQCTAYTRRPKTCADSFPVGGPGCAEARLRDGLPPIIASTIKRRAQS